MVFCKVCFRQLERTAAATGENSIAGIKTELGRKMRIYLEYFKVSRESL